MRSVRTAARPRRRPWIDRLAAGGIRFATARAHNVVTLPSHANILTGRLPPDHGVRDNAGFRLAATDQTLATLLKAQRVSNRRVHQRLPARLAIRSGTRVRRVRRRVRGRGAAAGVSRAGAGRRRDRRRRDAMDQTSGGRREGRGSPGCIFTSRTTPMRRRSRMRPGSAAIRTPAKSPRRMRRWRRCCSRFSTPASAADTLVVADFRSRRVAWRTRRGDARHLRLRGRARVPLDPSLPAASSRRASSRPRRATSISCR